MKAQVLHGIGDIRYEETDKPRIERLGISKGKGSRSMWLRYSKNI